jgi:DNA repair exonuclease SbcCD nuclease subunit
MAHAIVSASERLRVDVVLIAGDLIDAATQPEPFVQRLADAMKSVSAPIVAIPGNHDIAYGPRDGDAIGSFFARLGERATYLAAPHGASALVAGERIRVWGRGMPEHTRSNDPLDGLPEMPLDGAWNIALAHGELTRSPATPYSSPIILERHAAALRNVHYLALGHHHEPAAQTLGRTAVHYSGSASTVVGPGTVAVADFDGERAVCVIHALSTLVAP